MKIKINLKLILWLLYAYTFLICDIMRLKDFNIYCTSNSIGKNFNLQNCDNLRDMKKFTFIGWVKLRNTEDFWISNTKDVIFTLNSINETIPRLIFYFREGFYIDFMENANNVQSSKTEVLISDKKIIYENLIENWLLFTISIDYEAKFIYFRSGYYNPDNQIKLTLITGKNIQINNDKSFDLNTTIILSASQNFNDYGGCLNVNYIDFYFDWLPHDITSTSELNQMNLILGNYKGIGLNKSRILIKNFIRVKKRSLTEAFNTCTYSEETILNFISTNNNFIKNGNEVYNKYYFECIFGGNLPTDDLTIAFKIIPLVQKSYSIPILGFFYKIDKYNWKNNILNENLSLNILSDLISLKYDSNLKLILNVLGEEQIIKPPLVLNKGTSIIINLIKIESKDGLGINKFNRLIEIYFDGIKKFDYILRFDFGEVFSIINNYDVFFYIGDNISKFKNEYNFNFTYKKFNEENDIVTNTSSSLNISQTNISSSSTSSNTSSNTTSNTKEKLFLINDILVTENNLAKPGYPNGIFPKNCQLAIENFGCLWCNNGFLLNSLNSCISSQSLPVSITLTEFPQLVIECGFGYFYNLSLQICQECPIDCYSCNSLENCWEKKKGCAINCKRCTLNDLFKCIECSPGYFRDQFQNCLKCRRNNCKNCILNINTCSECFEGYYFNINNNKCEKCNNICKTCENSINICTSCNNNFYLWNNTCHLILNSYFTFKLTNSRRKCFYGCLECRSSNYNGCTKCLPDFLLVLNEKSILSNSLMGSCEIKCPNKYYYHNKLLNLNDNFCLPCSTTIGYCEECVNINDQTFCLKCIKGYYILNDINNNYNHLCVKCDINCKECISSSKNCISCNDGYKLESYDRNSFTCIYENNYSLIQNRIKNNFLPSCKENQYYNNNQCFNQCDNQYFRKKEYNNDCTKCYNHIEGCYGCNFFSGNCTLCLPNYNTIFTNNLISCINCQNNIVQCCDFGKGWEGGACINCIVSNCKDCIYSTKCSKCNDGYILSEIGLCLLEINNCEIYNFNKNKCWKCKNIYSLNTTNNQCLINCPVNYFKYISNGIIICEPCHENCLTCTKPNDFRSCLTCKAGFILSNNYCKPCKNYTNCQTYNVGTCTCNTCIISTNSLISGVCYAICPDGYFNNSGTCSSCMNCKNCVSSTINGCGNNPQCIYNHYISINSGVKACCPLGFYFNGTNCSNNCDTNCTKCTGTGASNCLETINGKYISGASYLDCNTNYKICLNGDTNLDFKEKCKYGYKGKFDINLNRWTSECSNPNWINGCNLTLYNFTELKNICIDCNSNLGLDLMDYTCKSICIPNYKKIKINYKYKGFKIYNKEICNIIPGNCTRFNEFKNLGCNTCKPGFYLINTLSFFKSYESEDSLRNVSFCNKCHWNCKTCLDSSFFSCLSCNDNKILFNGECLDKCPENYILNIINNKCESNVCSNNLLSKINSNNQIVCSKICNKQHYYDNKTNKCVKCNNSCMDCISNNHCKTCNIGYYLNFNNLCVSCTIINQKFNISNFNSFNWVKDGYNLNSFCSPTYFMSFILIRNYTNNIFIKNKINNITIKEANIDFNGLILKTTDIKFNFKFKIPLNNRTCYKSMISLDFNMNNYKVLHGNKLIIIINKKIRLEYNINKWDFYNEFNEYNNIAEIINRKYYFDNYQCKYNDYDIDIFLESNENLVDFNIVFKKITIHNLICPEQCLGCISWNQCSLCTVGSSFFPKLNKCIRPYDSLVANTNILTLRQYEFKNNTYYGYISENMNFEIPNYYFPNIKINNEIYENYKITYRYKNFISVDIENIYKYNVGKYDLSLYFNYPLVDFNRVGYSNYGFNSTIKFEDEFNQNIFDNYIKYLKNYSWIYQNIFIFLLLINFDFISYYFIDFINRIVILFFLNLEEVNGLDWSFKEFKFIYLNPNLLTNNFFSAPLDYLLKTNKNYIKLNYIDLFENINLKESIHTDFNKYIPQNKKLQKSKFKLNFIYNCDLIIFVIIIVLFIHLFFRILLKILEKKFYKKVIAIKNVKIILKFFEFNLYIKLFLTTFFPVIFFILNDVLYNSFNDILQIFGFIISIIFLIIYMAVFVMLFILTIKFPNLKEFNTANDSYISIKNKFKKFKEILRIFLFVNKLELYHIETEQEEKKKNLNLYKNDLEVEENLEDDEEGGGFNLIENELVEKLSNSDSDSDEDNKKSILKKLTTKRKKKKKKKKNEKKNFMSIKEKQLIEKEKLEKLKKEKKDQIEEIEEEEDEEDVDLVNKDEEEVLFEEEEEDDDEDKDDEEENIMNVNKFGEILGNQYKIKERRIYYWTFMFIRTKPWFIKFVFAFEFLAKFYFSITNFMKLIFILTIIFIKNPSMQFVIFLIIQIIFFIYMLFSRPFKKRMFNIYVVLNELFYLICLILILLKVFFGVNIKNNLHLFFISIILFANLVLYAISLFVKLIMKIIWVFKALDFKKKNIDDEEIDN